MQHLKVKYIPFTVLLFIMVFRIEAQETINQDVKVVREYNPTISDAFKINEMPSQSDTLKANPLFRYHLKGKAIITAPEMVPLVPAKLAKEPRQELYPSFISGYLGNYDVMGGQLLYNLVQNKDYALALKAGHESSWGDLELENKKEVKAPYHETMGGLYFRHFFKKKTLSVDMDFNNYTYNYYGMHTIDPDFDYYDPTPNPVISYFESVKGSELIPEEKQRQTTFDIDLGFMNQVTGNKEFQYDFGFKYSTFGSLTGVKENLVGLSGDIFVPVGDLNVNVDISIETAGTKIGNNNSRPEMFTFVNRQQTLIMVNPSLFKAYKSLKLNMGLRFAGETDDLGNDFYVSPNISANVVVAEGVITLEGGITGDVKPSTYRGIMAENPFISPDLNVKTAYHAARFFAGIKGNFSKATSFSARVDYSIFQDEHFFVNRTFTPFDDSDQQYTNLFDVDYDDGRLLGVSGEFKMRFIPELDIILRGAYYSWDLDSLQYAWHKPNMEIGLRGAYRFSRDLTITGAINLLGERFASIPNEIKKLDPVFDFNLGANYTLNARWSFFGNVQNMFASKYYRYQGYPMQSVNFRAGVGYSF